MVSIVPSRFAGLRIEDDDDDDMPRPKKANKNKNKTGLQTPENQNGKQGKNKKSNQQKRKKSNAVNEEQWKQWQERDKEHVDNTYEKDLEQALILSKLLEEKKSETEQVDKEKKSKSAKPKKQQPMNLHQFNQMLDDQTQTNSPIQEVQQKTNFFDNINEQAKTILRKEELQTIGQAQKKKIANESVLLKEKTFIPNDLDTNREMEQLRKENLKLKQELGALKDKCKRVATILKNAEVKEKVDILLEIDNLKKTQEEMSSEMSKLYIELEQEKSRTSQHYSTLGGPDSKGSRSVLKKCVRFDEQSFSEN